MGTMKTLRTLAPLASLGLLAACAVGEEQTGTQRAAVLATDVVINEFTAGSSGKIELYNPTASPIDLSNWKVDDVANGGAAPKSLGTGVVLQPGGFLLVSFGGINTSSTDMVRLVDANGVERDVHSNSYAGSSISGQCFGRAQDGNDWATGPIPCSLGTTNVVPPPPAGTVLRGTIVTPDTFFVGEVRIDGDTIVCVGTSCTVPGATVVETNGIIFPGLIDAHNHILFDVFDESDWTPPKVYTNHNQWTQDPKYKAMGDAKQWMNGEAGSTQDLGCEMDKYGELKGLVAGTTSILGAANSTNRACYGSLSRTIDQSPNDLGSDKMQVATIFPGTSTADGVCANLASGATNAYVIHVGEGVDQTALAEFGKLGTITTTDGCLYDAHTTIVHGTALGAPELQTMAASGMSLVWSPRSNVFLYGGGTDMTKTTDVPAALAAGINVALAPDWSIGGSQNLLDELRFADQVDAARWGNVLTPKQLVQMVTINAARALGLESVLGSIAVGKKADLLVISGNAQAPYDALLAARPKDVKMTIVGGTVLYGDLEFESRAPATPGCEHLDVCGTQKFVCVAESGGTSTNKLGQTYAESRAALDQGIVSYDARGLTPWTFAPIAPLVRCEAGAGQ
jgi:hypothetical protein